MQIFIAKIVNCFEISGVFLKDFKNDISLEIIYIESGTNWDVSEVKLSKKKLNLRFAKMYDVRPKD